MLSAGGGTCRGESGESGRRLAKRDDSPLGVETVEADSFDAVPCLKEEDLILHRTKNASQTGTQGRRHHDEYGSSFGLKGL